MPSEMEQHESLQTEIVHTIFYELISLYCFVKWSYKDNIYGTLCRLDSWAAIFHNLDLSTKRAHNSFITRHVSYMKTSQSLTIYPTTHQATFLRCWPRFPECIDPSSDGDLPPEAHFGFGIEPIRWVHDQDSICGQTINFSSIVPLRCLFLQINCNFGNMFNNLYAELLFCYNFPSPENQL